MGESGRDFGSQPDASDSQTQSAVLKLLNRRSLLEERVQSHPLAEAAKAYERVAEGKARFRAVLTM
jgi:D-arabinose 1-dehydrogenase-like Zn-dependent alcohol dehydrogenase